MALRWPWGCINSGDYPIGLAGILKDEMSDIMCCQSPDQEGMPFKNANGCIFFFQRGWHSTFAKDKPMKKLLLLVLLLFSAPLLAQTGIHYNQDRDGEGILMFEHTSVDGDIDVATFYFFTYNTHDKQIYLIGSDEQNKLGESEGLLYKTEGLDYPNGVHVEIPFRPKAVKVGVPFPIGWYYMRRAKEGGYDLYVVALEEEETLYDEFYETVFTFHDPILLKPK